MALSLEVVAKHAHVTVPSVRRARRDLRVAEATRVLIELRLHTRRGRPRPPGR